MIKNWKLFLESIICDKDDVDEVRFYFQNMCDDLSYDLSANSSRMTPAIINSRFIANHNTNSKHGIQHQYQNFQNTFKNHDTIARYFNEIDKSIEDIEALKGRPYYGKFINVECGGQLISSENVNSELEKLNDYLEEIEDRLNERYFFLRRIYDIKRTTTKNKINVFYTIHKDKNLDDIYQRYLDECKKDEVEEKIQHVKP